MALPVTIPNEFANATASIPLSQLDTNFTTLANAVNGISDGSETLANVTATVANITTLNASNVQVTNIKANDGTAAGSIADSTGVVTLASSVLTTTDINGGTIDGTAIGGSTPAAGSFTTLNTSGAVVFNDAGANVDFRVEGDTEPNLLFVDASTNAVGIGINAPTRKLEVAGTVNRFLFDTNVTNAEYRTTTADGTSFAVAEYNSLDHRFETSNTERMRITSAGAVEIANGNLVFSTDGTGIDFSASAGGGASSSILDDYEEGTWTPVVADATTGGNTGSASVNYATYVKIGKLVTIKATLSNIDTTGMTAANILYVRGVPFVSTTESNSFGAIFVDLVNFQAGRTYATCNIGISDTWIAFNQSGSGVNDTFTDCGDITSGTADIGFTLTYEAA